MFFIELKQIINQPHLKNRNFSFWLLCFLNFLYPIAFSKLRIMSKYKFSVSALIPAPPKIVYNIIVDYKNNHPKILPKPPFVSLVVEEGGLGAGSVLKVQMKVAGKLQTFKTVVTEPEPGRILVETNDTGYITNFIVEPRDDGNSSYVTFTTEIPDNSKLSKKIEFFFTKFYLPLVYKKELQMLAEEALNQSKTNQ